MFMGHNRELRKFVFKIGTSTVTDTLITIGTIIISNMR